MMNVAIMGYGTIGSGVAEVLEKNKEKIAKAAGQEIALKYVLDLREFPGNPIESKLIHDFSIIEQDPDVQIVVETMGGLKPAYAFVKACLLAGKHVVTSNKALVAAHGTELLEIAREKQRNFLFEASVGGGIPIIRPLSRCLMGEQIEAITGILNGTTNFILTKMDKEGWAFDAALKEAQRLGYAERNPEADVEGHDTCRKIAILTAMATGKEVNYEDIYTEGITRISATDFKYADKMGMSIKLAGASRMENGRVSAYVVPLMMNKEHPLYTVSDVFNGILVKGNMLGDSMFYGSGAGKLPTASAVAADIIDAAKHPDRNVAMGWSAEKQEISPMGANMFRYFIRVTGQPEERITELMAFGPREVVTLDKMDEFAIVSKPMHEYDFEEEVRRLDGVLKTIRVEL
ncbi:MAG: homoserine dehydrogenase [Lachnospiraceae bacterium]|nr:homoserine dehydrogenase [Lachnospiraceae bacterium]